MNLTHGVVIVIVIAVSLLFLWFIGKKYIK